MKEGDNRLICSDAKKAAIKATRFATASRRQNQICRVFECKMVEKRLNTKQKEQLKLLFVEGKRFYNYVLNIHQNGISLKDINTTNIKSVDCLTEDKKKVSYDLDVIGSQIKQSIVTRMISNEKTIMTLVKKGL